VKSFAGYKIGTYSSGMVKKLSLALAFIGEPALLLLDEPLVTVDQASVDFIYTLIEEYFQTKKATFLITSHQSFDNRRLTTIQK